jgi:mercuric reductase
MGEHPDHASLCVEAGCMPSKAIFEPIDAMHHAKRHGWLEVRPRKPDAYLAEIVTWKDRQIAGFRESRNEAIRGHESEDFQVIRAKARFIDAHTVEANGGRYTIDAAIIATGSANTVPDLDDQSVGPDGLWTNNEILSNTVLPKSLTVIGAGPVALEFSQRYARLGCAVTLVSKSRVLARFPKKFGERLGEIYEREGIRILAGHTLAAVKRNGDGHYRLSFETERGAETLTSERVLLATGRHPALEYLNLSALAVTADQKGKLAVGMDMRVVGCDNIFAAGDVAGLRQVVHQAHIEAGIAAENAVTDGNRRWERRSNLQVVFSDPEFAFAGQSIETAEQAGHKVVTASAESRDVGKLLLAGDDLGFGEFVADAETRKLLGAALLCDDASNLIHLPAYAIDQQQTVDELTAAEYYHPTKMEIVSEIGDALCRALGGKPFCRAQE